MARVEVLLVGGPADGMRVPVERGQALSVEGGVVPEGMSASYRPSRDPGVYRFKGCFRVIARIPMPGASS